ncbi:hypothetical protein OIV83_004701 [Microbotryomycetes sp. JL201]|nr:hypothetical protein OIV83_004701 [Microbotryomycetes sp. JL201]
MLVQDQGSVVKQQKATASNVRLALPPHIGARQDPSLLWQARTRWIAREVARGIKFPPKALTRLLNHRRIEPTTFQEWVTILKEKSVYFALERTGLLESAGDDRPSIECPSWLLLSIPSMIRTVADVPYVVSVLGSPAFVKLDRRSQSVFIARSLQHFLMVKHYVAARELVTWFCTTQTHLAQIEAFERLFAAILDHGRQLGTLNSPPPELIRALTDDIIITMRSRGVKQSVNVYRSLLHPFIIGSQSRQAMTLLREVEETYGFANLAGGDRQSITEQAMQVHSQAGQAQATDRFGQAAVSPKTGKHTSAHRNMMLRARRSSAADAAEYFDMLLDLPNEQRNIDEWTWTSLFAALADDDSISTDTLLRAMQRMEQVAADSSRKNPTSERLQHSRHLYHALLRGLLIRNENELVLQLWNNLQQNGLVADAHLVDVIARALCALDREHEAMAMLRELQSKAPKHSPSTVDDEDGVLFEPECPSGQRILEAVPFNNMMVRFRRTGEFARVWELFNSMQAEFEVKPDAVSITIVLDTARHASAAAGKGYGPGTEAIMQKSFKDDTWNDPESRGFLRKSAPAWRIAERLAWQVLESNWPEWQKYVSDPTEGGFSVLDWLSSRSSTSKVSTSNQLDAFEGTLSITEPLLYPQVFPTERFFRSFIQLIGYHSSPQSIAIILAWMRYIGVKPTHSTLTLAFMYIGEIGLEQRRMDKLRAWCREWLDSCPSEEDIAQVRRGNTVAGKPHLIR